MLPIYCCYTCSVGTHAKHSDDEASFIGQAEKTCVRAHEIDLFSFIARMDISSRNAIQIHNYAQKENI